MPDVNTDAISRQLLSTVHGVLLLGILSNAAFWLLQKALAEARRRIAVAQAARAHAKVVRQPTWDDVNEYLRSGPANAMVVHLVNALGGMIWWLLMSVFGFLLSYQTQVQIADRDRVLMTVASYWCMFQAFRAARTIQHAHKTFIQKPVRKAVEEANAPPADSEPAQSGPARPT